MANGLSTGHSSDEFDAADLAEGTEVELEHTSSRRVAQRIAMDHLVEDPDYYRKLRIVESPWFVAAAVGAGALALYGVFCFFRRPST